MDKKKLAEFTILSSFLTTIHLKPNKTYPYESPDFVVEDNNQKYTAIELVEFFNDLGNPKRGSMTRQVFSARQKFRNEIDDYLAANHGDKQLWVLIEIDDTLVDYKVSDAIAVIEDLLITGRNRTESKVTDYLLGIQINSTGGSVSKCCFVQFITGHEKPPVFLYDSVINTIDSKTEIKKKWKYKSEFQSAWLLIFLGDMPEQYTIEFDFALKIEDVTRYSSYWDRIYLFCRNRSKVINLL